MELGALICKPKAPLCLLCPLRAGCVAHATGLAGIPLEEVLLTADTTQVKSAFGVSISSSFSP